MSLKETSMHLMKLLETCVKDLQKANTGNKAAAQRVRTGTIRLEKCAKGYRKESIATEKKGGFKKIPKSGAKASSKGGKAKKGKKSKKK
jgi:hypothetical protein